MTQTNLCGECVPEPNDRIVIVPCPTTPPDEITIETSCPTRVNLPGNARPRSIAQWLKALADQFCTLNPLAIRSAAPCSIVTTVADPNGGSMLQPRSVLEALSCAPFTKAGQGFLFDGTAVKIAPIAPSVDRLVQLEDGPKVIVPGAFLQGKSGDTWQWKSGCLPPCPVSPGLTLQSTSNGGMQWGPQQPLGIQCQDLKDKLATCLKPKAGKPDTFIGFGSDNCIDTPFKYGWCEALRLGLKDCLSPKTGSPTAIVGFDAEGNPFKFQPSGGSIVDCATLKLASPLALPDKRATEIYGVGSDGVCNRFVRECDCNFRATSSGTDISTGTKLIGEWGGAPLYSKMTQDYNQGDCAGTFAIGAGGFQQYTVKSAGRYAIEASSWVNVRFVGSGPGIIHPDAIWAIVGAIVIANGGPAGEFRIGESSDTIDYVYDPGNAYTVNNCTKGLIQIGMDFFFSRTILLDLVAGATISVPRFKVNTVHNASDITAVITTRTDGESSLAVTKLAKPSF